MGIGPGSSVDANDAVAAFGSLWVPVYPPSGLASPHGWLVRVDLTSRRVTARIPVGESPDGGVAIVDGSVWVANTSGDASRRYAGQDTLSRIDPQTNLVVATIPVEVGGPIAGGFGAIWVPGRDDGTGNGVLRKVGARTNRVVTTLPLPGRPMIACAGLWTIDTIIGDAPRA